MKLDFSALAQPAARARGQVGTTGTPASTRVCASPTVPQGQGTSGDSPATVVLAADPVVVIPAICPPLSPACPQTPNPEKLNAGAVSPASPLVPGEIARVAAAASSESEDLADEPTGANVNTCGDCQHLLRRGTCGEPHAAGLLSEREAYGIVWPAEGYGAACPAFTGKVSAAAAVRPRRLTHDQARTGGLPPAGAEP